MRFYAKFYLRLAEYYRDQSRRIARALILLGLTIGLNLLKPWPIKIIIDKIIPARGGRVVLPFALGSLGPSAALTGVALLLLMIFALWGVFNLLSGFEMIDVGLKAQHKLRGDLYARLLSLRPKYFEGRGPSDSAYRLSNDCQAVRSFFNQGFASILEIFLTVGGVLAVLFRLNAHMAWLTLTLLPLVWVVLKRFSSPIRRHTEEYYARESALLEQVTSAVARIRSVKIFLRTGWELRRFSLATLAAENCNREMSRVTLHGVFASSLVMGVVQAILLFCAVNENLHGRMPLGDLVVFFTYLSLIGSPLERLSYMAWSLEGPRAALERVFAVLDESPEDTCAPPQIPLLISAGTIEFREVCFAYQSERPLLQNISFLVPGGSRTALVGPNGAGKSTVFGLICNFVRPDSGTVLFDRQDIAAFHSAATRCPIAAVFSDAHFIRGTIAENIAYGFAATREHIEEAAEWAQADAFISALPAGYETFLGDGPDILSAGQIQLLAIARALVRRAPILILDEPTSALEPQLEERLMRQLAALPFAPTLIMVSHRLRAIHDFDQILVLANGRIAECGTGAELLRANGIYAKMWGGLHPRGTESQRGAQL